MSNDSCSKVIGVGTIKVRMFDNVVRSLIDVKYIPKLKRSLIYLGALDIPSYDFYAKNSIMIINKGALITKKWKKVKNLYILIEKTILGGSMKVELSHESFASVKEVFKVEKRNKLIKTSFSSKSTHWYKDENNCKRNEVMKKIKTIYGVKFKLDTCLFSLVVQY